MCEMEVASGMNAMFFEDVTSTTDDEHMIDFICKSDINSSDSAVDYQEAEVVIDSEYEENESPIRVYLSYFQLKFHVTDREMQLFLSFMDVLIALISTGKKTRRITL